MGRGQVIALVAVSAVLACATGFYFGYRFEAYKEQFGSSRRQLIYQSTLDSYRSVLKTGMTRAQVEDYLRAKGAKFDHICCLESDAPYADITKIGYETGPWYCDGYEVNVAFQFHGAPVAQDAQDTLERVSIFSQPDNCL